MGRDRSERQDKSAAEVSLKLHNDIQVSRTQAFEYWNTYQDWRKNGMTAFQTMNYLSSSRNLKFMYYFAALAMEIISKEIIEGINVDKKES